MSILLMAILTAPLIACGADIGEAGDSRPPKTIAFFGGCKTHAPGAHEQVRGAQLLKRCLDTAPGLPPLRTRIYLDTWPQDPGELDDAATIVLTWEGCFQNEDLRRLALNAILWTAQIDVPSGGVQSAVSPDDFRIAP